MEANRPAVTGPWHLANKATDMTVKNCSNGGFDHTHPSAGGKERCNHRLREKGAEAVRRHVARQARKVQAFREQYGKTFWEMAPEERRNYQLARQREAEERQRQETEREIRRREQRHKDHTGNGVVFSKKCIICEDFVFHCLKDGCWGGVGSPASHVREVHVPHKGEDGGQL